ncbi:hypothetical protein H072_8626 [Dactylellina haptotyla CBS 200.50]|uniref:Uncharacterized protein n=1 Tax=Dactylellina haptotyla (strain CBS 200.50) TaxID=1284197 RepID=S8BEI2_DACHA|nr:hypothetical protein H072_8626 [Dactylellina haptotyla CBS 200.50]
MDPDSPTGAASLAWLRRDLRPIYDQAQMISKDLVGNRDALNIIIKDLKSIRRHIRDDPDYQVENWDDAVKPNLDLISDSVEHQQELWSACFSKFKALISRLDGSEYWIEGANPIGNFSTIQINCHPMYEILDIMRHMNMSLSSLDYEVPNLVEAAEGHLKKIKGEPDSTTPEIYPSPKSESSLSASASDESNAESPLMQLEEDFLDSPEALDQIPFEIPSLDTMQSDAQSPKENSSDSMSP